MHVFHIVLLLAAPLLLDNQGELRKLSAQRGQMTSFSLKIYSVSPVNVTLESASQNTQRTLTYTTHDNQTRVTLKVFDSDVEADGVTVVVSFTISSQEEFGEYQLVISNNIMPAVRRIIEIVSEGDIFYL